MFLRLAAGSDGQVLLQNDGHGEDLGQGKPVHAFLPAEACPATSRGRATPARALRVLGGRAPVAGLSGAAAGEDVLRASRLSTAS